MKVYLDTIGCRLNQSEIEKIASQLRAGGAEVVAQASEADIAIVNTCAVTSSASSDSRKVIRRIANSGCTNIYATGCYATISPEEVNKLPSIARLYSNEEKNDLSSDLLKGVTPESKLKLLRIPLPGKQKRTRAFIKVQDGCDNHCTFCITRLARGKSRSQAELEIFEDVEFALLGGVKEIVLTGVNLGAWGRDFGEGYSLSNLIIKIMKRYSPERLRLSSLEPWDIDDSFFPIFSSSSFCKHLHLPIQAGSDFVLQRMQRRMLTNEYKNLIEKVRACIPDVAITTDIMVGFPGESEEEFEKSIEFIRQMNFAGGHVFRYSPRVGTAAIRLDQQISEAKKKHRSSLMRQVIAETEKKYKEKFIEHVLSVLWEKSIRSNNGEFSLEGLSENYIRVRASSGEDMQNKISKVRIVENAGKYVLGKFV